MNNSAPDSAGAAGIGIVFLVLYLAVSAGMIALGAWITSTLIWRAVRRGLRELHQPGVRFNGGAASGAGRLPAGPRNW